MSGVDGGGKKQQMDGVKLFSNRKKTNMRVGCDMEYVKVG